MTRAITFSVLVLITGALVLAILADPQGYAQFPGPQLTDSQMPKGW